MIRSVILAARPKTLPAAIVPVWTGCCLAWLLDGTFLAGAAILTLLGALCIQIATNFFNDAIDAAKGADTAERVGPARVTASGMMSSRTVIVLGLLFVALAFVCGIPLYHLRGWPIIAIGLPSLYLTYGYTGGPWPLAYRGLGELFVFLFFGLVAVAGTVFIQTGGWHPEAFLLGAQVGLLSTVLISINNLRDRAEDTLSNKRTLAVRLGEKGGRLLIVAEVALAFAVSFLWFLSGVPWLAAVCLPILLLGLPLVRGVTGGVAGSGLNRFLALGSVLLMAFATAIQIITLLTGG